ncbi:MAG: hypothetical protein NVSMB6_10290 [Burkholderiaceae bacterium]
MSALYKRLPVVLLAGVIGVGLVTFALTGCERSSTTSASNGIRQTGFPGQVTAGGDPSGRVIARMASAAPAAPATGGTQSPQESLRGQSPSGSVAGTPSIPEGSGGTTSGAAMGGTTPGAAATKDAPAPGGATPSVPSSETKK